AERTVERVLGVATADLAHSTSPSAACRTRQTRRVAAIIPAGLSRVRSRNATNLRVLGSIPAKSPLANHGSVGIIKILLMMKFEPHGDFWTASRPARGPFPKRPAETSEAAGGNPRAADTDFSSLGDVLGPLVDHLVDDAPFHRHFAGEEVVALE